MPPTSLSLVFPPLHSSSWVWFGSVLHHHSERLRETQVSAVIRNSNPPAGPRARRGSRGQRDVMGEWWLSGHKPRGTHKSCQFPEARRSNGSQVRDPPAARRLDAIKQWPPEVLKVGLSGSLHPGSNLCPMPAPSLCVCPYISLSSALLFVCSKVRHKKPSLGSDGDIT